MENWKIWFLMSRTGHKLELLRVTNINTYVAFRWIVVHNAISGWVGRALAHTKFGVSVNPVLTKGADYAHHTSSPPGFENLTSFLYYHAILSMFDQCGSSWIKLEFSYWIYVLGSIWIRLEEIKSKLIELVQTWSNLSKLEQT